MGPEKRQEVISRVRKKLGTVSAGRRFLLQLWPTMHPWEVVEEGTERVIAMASNRRLAEDLAGDRGGTVRSIYGEGIRL